MLQRPITFAYNGGPGGSSAGVHVGAFGPRVIAPLDPKSSWKPTAEVTDNPDSLLDVSDIVFLDPVGSGFSRLLPGTEPSAFYGIEQDADATARFIDSYLTTTSRRESPTYLLGESYGTLRTVLTARKLQQIGCFPRGLILMGLILDNTTLFPQAGNDEPYWLFLPTETAINQYHSPPLKKASRTYIDESARMFASGIYLAALAKGDRLEHSRRMQVAKRLAALTGIRNKTILAADLRFNADQFSQQRLHSSGKVLSKADGRFVGVLGNGKPNASTDPLYAEILPVYATAIDNYFHKELAVPDLGSYTVLDTQVADHWQWGSTVYGSPTAVSVGYRLRDALMADPKLKVFCANGIYDRTSPFFAAEYTLSHLGLAAGVRSRIKLRFYSSGHMIYVSGPERTLLHRDIASFIGNTI